MNFRPLHDGVVIRRLNTEERTTGGIIQTLPRKNDAAR